MIAIISSFAIFSIYWAGPHLFGHPIVLMVVSAAFTFNLLKLMERVDWTNAEAALSCLAVVAGTLPFMIFLEPLQELDRNRLDNTTGMALVNTSAVVGLLLLRAKVRKAKP